jgi:hypothetical protein
MEVQHPKLNMRSCRSGSHREVTPINERPVVHSLLERNVSKPMKFVGQPSRTSVASSPSISMRLGRHWHD